MKVVVIDVVTLGRGVGMTAFWEHAALIMLGLKVCRITGVVMVLNPVALLLAKVALILAVPFMLVVTFLPTEVG